MTESSFSEWTARDYLAEYYSGEVTSDELHVIRYLVEQLRTAPRGPLLCFGSGPTLHHVFAAAPHSDSIYLCDYVANNLDAIEAWRAGDDDAHDWSKFVRYTLKCETGHSPSEGAVAERIALTRSRVVALERCDAGRTDPITPTYRGFFATVLSPYCADSATDDKETWARYSRNIASLVRPSGLLVTIALRGCQRYKVGQRYFPSANIDEHDLRAILGQDFAADSIEVETREVPDFAEHGFSGILLARACKSEPVRSVT